MSRGCVQGQDSNASQQFAKALLASLGMTVMPAVPFWMMEDLCLGHLQTAAGPGRKLHHQGLSLFPIFPGKAVVE